VKRLVGFLGWIGVALVVAAVVLRFSRPDLAVWSQRTALAGLVVTLLYSLSQWRDIARSFGSRNVKYGSIAATSVVVVLGILAGINWIANRQNKRWDVSSGGQFSLSDQTKQILASLDKPVTIKAFYLESSEQVRDQLQEYAYHSGQIKTEFIDILRDPVSAGSLGVDSAPTYVLQYDGRTQKATGTDEQALTNALKKVVEGKTKKIYFVIGHGEHDPSQSDNEGYSAVSDALKNDNFETAPLNLPQQGAVPDDASVLVIAGPRIDFQPAEIEILRAWVRKGGKVAILLDPPDKGSAPEPANLIAFAREWGIEVGKDLVVDVSGVGQRVGTGPFVPIAGPTSHPITDPMGNVGSAFPLARSVSAVEGGVDGKTAQRILETSDRSWADSDVAGAFGGTPPERNLEGGDKAGPIGIGAAVSAAAADTPPPPAPAAGSTPAPDADAPKPESRVVVIGDSDFAANRWIGLSGNRDLFLNMANWLAQQENLIAIRPRQAEDRPISMTEDQATMVLLFGQYIVPALLLLTGVLVWWKKR
jgi:ABC-type uncharacterized transport system involved in gliding motility auxiliary subunit